jgi:alpha-L-fucosidase
VRNPYTGEEIPYTGFKPVSSFPGFMNDQMRELIDRYDPDLIWCDGDWERNAAYWNLAGTVAHYYNQAQDRRHPKGVAINDRCKLQDGGRQPDYLTPERRTLDYIEPYKWETAETIAGWFYFDEPYRLLENEQLLEMLIDIVSKNGNLLLNVSPRADGTIPDYQQEALREIGRWLDINGEAIYGTTYWSQSSDRTANVPVRFTQRSNAFYATALEWPGEQLSLPGHVPTTAGTEIRLLGADDAQPLTWRKQGGRLVIDTPAGGPAATASAYAYTFKVSTPGLPLIRTTFDAPAEVKRGDVAPVKVTVTNPGETSTPPGEVGLGLSGGDGVTAEPAAFTLPQLEPGASTTFETTLRVATDAPYGSRTLTATLRMRRHTIETPLSIPVSRPNHALDMPSTQSSTDFGGEARRANDGNTDGNYFNNSISHTGFDTNAWWQVDLGESRPIHEIEVWNRTDCCTDRLQDYYVLVSDEPFAGQSLADTLAQPGVWHSRQQAPAGRPTTIPVGRSGRYVRVQLAGQNWLTIGEVRVLGE